MRDLGEDYGIDAEIELFDATDSATGAKFYVQLKATDAKLSGALYARLDVSTGGYYESLDLPVLLVLYHAPSRALYTRWFHTLTPPEEGVNSVRVRFSGERIWTNDSPDLLEKELDAFRKLRAGTPDLPLRFSLNVDAHIAKVLSPAALGNRLRAAAGHEKLQFVWGEEWCAHTIEAGSKGFTVRLAGVRGFEFATPGGLLGEVPPTHLHWEVLLGVALALDYFGQGELTASLLGDVAPHTVFARDPQGAMRVGMSLIRAKQPSRAVVLAEQLVRDEATAFAARMLMVAFSMNASEISPPELEFALTILDRIAISFEPHDRREAAITRYNMGRVLAEKDRLRESLKWHLRAARLHPPYRRQSYWWIEAAGLLFLNHRYKPSVFAYRKGLEGADTPKNRVLLADALLFSGEYGEALAELSRSVPRLDPDDPRAVAEWELKRYVLSAIIGAAGVERQNRARSAADAVLPAERPTDAALVEICTCALKLDALCTRAWLNLGVASASLDDKDGALTGFLVAAVLDRGDVDAWADAASWAMHRGDADLLQWITICAQEIVGDGFVLSLADAYPEEFSDMIYSSFSSDSIPPRAKKPVFEIRAHGPDDEVDTFRVERD